MSAAEPTGQTDLLSPVEAKDRLPLGCCLQENRIVNEHVPVVKAKQKSFLRTLFHTRKFSEILVCHLSER